MLHGFSGIYPVAWGASSSSNDANLLYISTGPWSSSFAADEEVHEDDNEDEVHEDDNEDEVDKDNNEDEEDKAGMKLTCPLSEDSVDDNEDDNVDMQLENNIVETVEVATCSFISIFSFHE